MALSLTAETESIDSEKWLFDYKLQEYKDCIPNLISRRQFNDRRKKTAGLCEELRKRVAMEMDGGEAVSYTHLSSNWVGMDVFRNRPTVTFLSMKLSTGLRSTALSSASISQVKEKPSPSILPISPNQARRHLG